MNLSRALVSFVVRDGVVDVLLELCGEPQFHGWSPRVVTQMRLNGPREQLAKEGRNRVSDLLENVGLGAGKRPVIGKALQPLDFKES